MRIGGGIDGREWRTPEEWLSVVKQLGYDAVYCPIDSSAPESLRRDFKKLIKDNGLVLGEVGAWSNPLEASTRSFPHPPLGYHIVHFPKAT